MHASLLTDYYEPETQPRVFFVHRAANPLSRVTAVAIGAGAGILGWESMFLVLAAPTVLLIGAATRLREPRRGAGPGTLPVGEMDADTAPAAVPSFGDARRILFAIRSMRRLYLGAFLLGFGFLTIGAILSLFFEDIYDFSPLMRGVAAFLGGVGTLAGLAWGERLSSRALAAGREDRLAVITGLAFSAGAVGLIVMSIAPWAPVSLAFSVLANAGFSAFTPAYYPLVALVTPGHIRTQAYGWSLILVGLGGLIGSLVIGGLAEGSYRTATAGLAVTVAIAGVVGMSARRFVADDVAAAAAAAAGGASPETTPGSITGEPSADGVVVPRPPRANRPLRSGSAGPRQQPPTGGRSNDPAR